MENNLVEKVKHLEEKVEKLEKSIEKILLERENEIRRRTAPWNREAYYNKLHADMGLNDTEQSARNS